MADPEQIYQEVLTEEQGKGVSAPVAEGRAKAARARAEAGSPHPKEPKWWPGAQPHLEGGDAAPSEEPAEEPAEAEPVDETVEAAAQDEPAEAPVAEETPAATEEVQAPQVPQEQAPPPAEPAPPAPDAAQPAAAAVAAAPEAKAGGVIHGTATGTRVRPEDAATTDAQYQGQMDMYARRKLIDELVGTGVPVVSAADTGQRRSPALAVLYLLIPIIAIAFLLANNDSTPAAAEGEHGGGEAGGITLSAAAVQFDTDQLSWPAGEETTVAFHNEDSVPHNFSIYTDESGEKDLFVGPEVGAGASADYAVDPLEAGEYFFRCDLHPTSMTGTVTIE